MPFYYGGCEGEKKIFVSRAPSPNVMAGNGNKYDSEEECQKACPKEFLQADICQLPKETGPCFDLVERYYFDFQMGTCQRFEFGGCEGIILLLPIESSLILNLD